MIKSIPLQPGESVTVVTSREGKKEIDYIVPDGFVAVVTIVIELYQKFPKGIFIPGQTEGLPGGRGKP
uniref:Uncharacterized protein n=1 Tax=viral metagenome TaxID=1070528 RepID=A0A6M3JQB5_9ZZZZ